MTRFDVHTTSDTLASPGADLGPKRDDEAGGNWPMREAVGTLLWLWAMTRPDITKAVRAVERYTHDPTERLWQAIMKILSNLNGTKSFGITYVWGSGLGLEVYADADYVDKANDRHSVSGIAVTLGGTVVSQARNLSTSCRRRSQRQSTLRLGTGSSKLCLCVPSVFHCARDEWSEH